MITNDIIEWVKEQPYWQQLIAEKLLNSIEITNEDIEEFYQTFKVEKLDCVSLEKKELIFPVNKSNDETSSTIRWKGLSDVNGVNAIKNNQNFPIGKEVTLIYGENGSGKSGYTRLLNNIFISKGDKNILPNLFEDENISSSFSSNVIFEDVEGNEEIIHYPHNQHHPYTKQVTVFDSQSAIHNLTKETELSFAPIEFKFFDDFLFFINEVNNKLEEEISRKDTHNYFIDSFYKDTSIKQLISELSSDTNIEQLKKIIKVSQTDIKNNESASKRKAELQLLNIDDKKKEFNTIISEFVKIKKQITMLNQTFSAENISKIKKLIYIRNHYKDISLKEGLVNLKSENIENLDSKEWKDFIIAAKKYYETIEQEINYCIFCKQDIRGINIIDKYWKYLKSDAEYQLNYKNKEIETTLKELSDLNCNIIIQKSKIDEWIKENCLKLHKVITEGEAIFNETRKKMIQSLSEHKWNENIDSFHIDLNNINMAIELVETMISKLNAEDVENELKQLQITEDEYTDKLKAEKLLPSIEKFIQNKKWVKLAKKNKVTTRPITIFHNTLFSKYVTDEYIKIFNEECKKLNAEFSAEIKQRGSKGKTLSRLTIKEKKPLDILSEGEQRSIALANFLAETSLHKNNICIIFDDPVSSLDFKRRETIADRLIEEAHHKQVVIFTHDLTFLLTLQNKCEVENLDCLTSTIRKIQNSTGIIENTLPWIGMPVGKRVSHLKNNLQSLSAIHRKISPDAIHNLKLYEDGAKLWCKELRETWERCIEEILFNNSVQRFSPSIQTQRLERAPFTKELYSEVHEGMKNCSNWVHDRAAGLGEETPSPDTLKEYLNDFESFIKKNRPK